MEAERRRAEAEVTRDRICVANVAATNSATVAQPTASQNQSGGGVV